MRYADPLCSSARSQYHLNDEIDIDQLDDPCIYKYEYCDQMYTDGVLVKASITLLDNYDGGRRRNIKDLVIGCMILFHTSHHQSSCQKSSQMTRVKINHKVDICFACGYIYKGIFYENLGGLNSYNDYNYTHLIATLCFVLHVQSIAADMVNGSLIRKAKK